jgi:hypothetical protein
MQTEPKKEMLNTGAEINETEDRKTIKSKSNINKIS